MVNRIVSAVVLISAVAAANPLTVTFSGVGSGTFTTSSPSTTTTITNQNFTITFTTDTSLLSNPACCTADLSTPLGTPATISFGSVTNATFTQDQAVFLNSGECNIGIWHLADGGPDFLDIGNCEIANYNFSTSLPAVSGTINFFTNTFSTSAGNFSFTAVSSVNVTVTVSSTVGSALRFVPVTPCRVVDTRNANGPFGGPLISGGTSRSFAIPSGSCGIPNTAQAYSLNVGVVPTGDLSYLTVWPTGQSQPYVSTLNSVDGRVKANAAIVPAGTGGAVSVYATNDTQVILDINGYFVPAATSGALAFYPLTPCRLVDTRSNLLASGPLTGGTTTTLPILSSTCNVPATAQAYSLNFTAVPPGALGYLTVWPAGHTQPVVATLNDTTGTDVANAAIVQAGTNGSIDVFPSNTTQLVVDINGYFAPPETGGLSLYPLLPCRVLDTRQPPMQSVFSNELDVTVSAGCSFSGSPQAYVLNATVVPTAELGYLTLWPQGTPLPTMSTLNAVDGAVTNNMAIVATTNGEISAYATNSTNLVLDIFGFFAP